MGTFAGRAGFPMRADCCFEPLPAAFMKYSTAPWVNSWLCKFGSHSVSIQILFYQRTFMVDMVISCREFGYDIFSFINYDQVSNLK